MSSVKNYQKMPTKASSHILFHLCGNLPCVILKSSSNHMLYMNSLNDFVAHNMVMMILFTCLNVLGITVKNVMMVLFTYSNVLRATLEYVMMKLFTGSNVLQAILGIVMMMLFTWRPIFLNQYFPHPRLQKKILTIIISPSSALSFHRMCLKF